MLSFLRQVRRTFIENGNIQKYLLYAIGEIVLVVVGILIALQINNWNEKRKEKQKIDLQVSSLCEDLRRDSLHLNEVTNDYAQKIKSLRRIESCYDSIHMNHNSWNCLEEILSHSSTFINLKNTDKTIEQLKRSGQIGFLDREAVNLILDYDKLILEYKTDENSVFQEMQTVLRTLTAKIVNFGSFENGIRNKAEPYIIYNETILNEVFNVLQRYLVYCEANITRLTLIQERRTILRNYFLTGNE